MGAETFSDFLIPLKFKLDEPSKKRFDETVAEVEKRFKAIGAAGLAAATALAFAVREISKNLAGLAYASERVGASSEEFKALGTAADRVGIGAEAAKSSLSKFFEFVNFEGGASAIKQWFNTGDFDPMHPLKVFLDSAVKLSDEYAKGGVARQTAIVEARRAGYNDTLITTPGAAGRLRDEIEKDEAFTGGKLNPIAEKAKRLNAEFEKVSQHLKTISELVSGSLMDAFSDLLGKADGWLKAHRDDIIWFSNQAAELAKNIMEVTKSEVRLLARLEANTAELMRTQDVIKTIREALKWLGGGDIASKINAALEWAFQPFKWLWDKLQSLGLVGPSVGGSGAGASAGAGGSFGPGEGTESGGHGAERRGRFGHGGTASGWGRGPDAGGGGAVPKSGPPGSVYSMIDKAAGGDKRVADAMKAIFEGESDHRKGVFDIGDKNDGGAYGPFQMNMGGGRLGAQFQKATGLDPRDPANQQAVANWVAKYIKDRPGLDIKSVWHGYRHGLERIQRGQVHPNDTVMNVPAAKPTAVHPSEITHAEDFHKALETIRAAKPLTPWQQSTNEHHDNRSLYSNVEVKVAGVYPIDKTAHPLERTKNATLIRNTTATAS